MDLLEQLNQYQLVPFYSIIYKFNYSDFLMELENTHTFCPDWIITDTTIIIGQKIHMLFHFCSQINMVRDFTFFSHQIRGSFKAPKLAKFDNL